MNDVREIVIRLEKEQLKKKTVFIRILIFIFRPLNVI